MAEFRMPSLGADMDEATLLEWLVKPGDRVKRGDAVAVVDTAKAAMDVEVFADGLVESLLVAPGTTVAVGTPLARISTVSESVPPPAAGGTGPPPPAAGAPVPPPAASRVRPPSPLVRRLAAEHHLDLATLVGTGRNGALTRRDVDAAIARSAPPPPPPPPSLPRPHRASPLARRRAAELGVDLATVTGSGPGGAVTEADVRGAAPTAVPVAPVPPAPQAVAAAAGTARLAALQRAVAALMSRSTREIPHYHVSTAVDLHALEHWLATVNAERPPQTRLVPAAFLLKAAAVAARRVPEVNGVYVEDAFRPADRVDLGIAVSLRGGGLVAPAILGADELEVDVLMDRLRDLVARARRGRLRREEMAGPTLTVTNLGELGVDAVHGVIYPPQVALVGFGRIASRAWAVDGMLTVRPIVVATLAGDHRVSDGHRGSRYLALVEELLQHPDAL